MVSPSEMKSPGVFISEVDLSTYAALMDTSKYLGLILVAQNGPINEVVDIAKVSEFEEVFGNPISVGGLASIFYLGKTNSLKVVRFAGSSAESRSVTLKGKGEGSQVIESAVVASYKYEGTLFSDDISITVKAVPEASDDVRQIIITKGEDKDILADGVFTIKKDSATKEIPYLIGNESTDFRFTLGSESAVLSLDPVENAKFSVGNNGEVFTDEDAIEALELFNDTENIDLDFISAPGILNPAVQLRLITVAEDRKDCTAILDTPQGLTPNQAADYVDGKNDEYPMQKLDSSYAAVYYPWGKVYNQYSGAFEWVPASVGVLTAFGEEYSPNSGYNSWTPPAGVPRMMINVFSEVERKLNRKDRDILYTSNINPLCNYKGLGLTAFGQKTLQRKKSSLDRLNVRFLTNYIKKIADYASVLYLFNDINDETFESWVQDMDKQLSDIKTKGGVYDYKITMDWTTVTDEYLNNNIMPGIIQIKPTKTAEFIPIDVVLRNKSDDFN